MRRIFVMNDFRQDLKSISLADGDIGRSFYPDRLSIDEISGAELLVNLYWGDKEVGFAYVTDGTSAPCFPIKKDMQGFINELYVAGSPFKLTTEFAWLNEMSFKSNDVIGIEPDGSLYLLSVVVVDGGRSWVVLDPSTDTVCDANCQVAIRIGSWELAIYLSDYYIEYDAPWIKAVYMYKDGILVDEIDAGSATEKP
jgi:hypothetical protein